MRLIVIIAIYFFICGYTLELPEPLNVNDGDVASSIDVFYMAIKGLNNTNIILCTPILEDTEYVLYPKELILKQFSLFPSPNKFANTEHSNCNHGTNFYKTLSQQTMPGAPCIYISGLRFTETGFTRHAWLGVLSRGGEIIMLGGNRNVYQFILKLNVS